MAGIGFELRKLLRRESYFSLLEAYFYAGMIGSGPWVLSIIGILLVGFISFGKVLPEVAISQFQVSVTYLIALSLILTGFVQLAFTRYIADREFEMHQQRITPTLMGMLFVILVVAGGLATPAALLGLPGTSLIYRLLMVCGFVVLCLIWVVAIFLSGMKHYRSIVAMFGLGYGTVVLAAYSLRPYGLEGLLLGFVLGHLVLLLGMLALTLRHYPGETFISFDPFRRGRMYLSLMWVGFIYNFAVWIDKFLFWYWPGTGQRVIGQLQASLIHDLPVFLAYLSIIPGMAAFLVRIETDFVEYYQKFYSAVREGASLDYIEAMKDEMVFAVRQGLLEIIKIQAMAVLAVFVLAPRLLDWLGISQLYLYLLYVQVVAAGLQVALLGVLNVFFYLDQRRIVVWLSSGFALANVCLTVLSLRLGAAYYGYGFALSLLLTVLAGLALLTRVLDRLEYETFMLQR